MAAADDDRSRSGRSDGEDGEGSWMGDEESGANSIRAAPRLSALRLELVEKLRSQQQESLFLTSTSVNRYRAET